MGRRDSKKENEEATDMETCPDNEYAALDRGEKRNQAEEVKDAHWIWLAKHVELIVERDDLED